MLKFQNIVLRVSKVTSKAVRTENTQQIARTVAGAKALGLQYMYVTTAQQK